MMTLTGGGAITNDVLKFRKVIEFEISCIEISFSYIYLIIDRKRLSINKIISHKMVKHTQTIRRQFADELFECVWPFFDIGA